MMLCFNSLLLITIHFLIFGQACCNSFFKRTIVRSLDLNRIPSPDSNDVEITSHPSHDQTATSSHHLGPTKTIEKRYKKTKLSSLTIDHQKRERRNERVRMLRKEMNEAYDNRFNLPPDSEERKAIEEKMVRTKKKISGYVSNRYRKARDAVKSGNATENQLRAWNVRKASSGANRKRIIQKVKEGIASEHERAMHQNILDNQKRYRQTHREQINVAKKAQRERQKAKKLAKSL